MHDERPLHAAANAACSSSATGQDNDAAAGGLLIDILNHHEHSAILRPPCCGLSHLHCLLTNLLSKAELAHVMLNVHLEQRAGPHGC